MMRALAIGERFGRESCSLARAMEPPTALFLPRQLPYPLTVQRLLRPATEPHPAQARLLEQLKSPALVKTDSLLTYSFRNTHGEREVRVWESPVAGELQKWCIDEGQLLLDARYARLRLAAPAELIPPANPSCWSKSRAPTPCSTRVNAPSAARTSLRGSSIDL